MSQFAAAAIATEREAQASHAGEDAAALTRPQIPVPSLAVAAALSGTIWYGIYAGLRWIWQSF